MELKDTVVLMESNDFKDRFKAEYYQTKIRYEKLHNMIGLFKDQAKAMEDYLYILEVRAQIEGIEL